MAKDVKMPWRGRRRRTEIYGTVPNRFYVFIDVDGCLTDGKLYVNKNGRKPFKAFGPDDHDAINRWRNVFHIHMITADDQLCTRKRAEHMDVPLLVAASDPLARSEKMKRWVPNDGVIVYMGDGYHDAGTFSRVSFGIAPANAWPGTLRAAHAVTSRAGGDRAVAQALDFIGTRLIEQG